VPGSSAEALSARGRLNVLRRYHPDTSPAVTAARLTLTVARLRDHIAEAITSSPPLTAEQRCELASMLLAAPEAGNAHAST
jgi:hypothetical protein